MSKVFETHYDIVRGKAIRYMDSYPGLDNAGGNTHCHSGFHDLVKGAEVDSAELQRLEEILDYRGGQIKLAETYRDTILGPEGEHADQFDDYQWRCSLLRREHKASPEDSEAAVKILGRWDEIWTWQVQLGIFNPRTSLPGQWYGYYKPGAYLAAKLAESSLSIQQIRKDLEKCSKDLTQDRLENVRLAATVDQSEIKTLREQL